MVDPKDAGVGAVVGVALWELLKQVSAALFKRASEANDTKRRLLREDIEQASGMLCELLEAAVHYYATPFDAPEAQELSKKLRGRSKTIGMKLSNINIQLADNNTERVNISLWTKFKSACMQSLDVARQDVWGDDDERISAIYQAAHALHASLNRARYAAR